MASDTNDKMVKDVRTRLKDIANKGGKYFTGTAKLFLHSTTSTVSTGLPALKGMVEANKDLMNDTVRFLRNPVDTVNRNIDRAMQTEGWKALKKVASNALDDLKTGNLYDENRSRTEYGSAVDSLMDNFGDFDMSGFDESGDYLDDFDVPDIDAEASLMEYHEEVEDARTTATIGAMEASTKAIVNTENSNAQLDIRTSVKQHSQIMNSMENIITQQAATLTAINSMAESMLEVKREAHNEMLDQMKSVTSLLTDIKKNTAPPETQRKRTPRNPIEFLNDNGSVDLKGWMNAAFKKLDETYNINSIIGIGTAGGDVTQILEPLMDNPLSFITDQIVSKILNSTGVQKSIDRTSEYLKSFIPSLLDKFADMGKRFERPVEEGGGHITDLIAGMFGVQNRARTSIKTNIDDLSKQAVITNRTIHAIEQVIPMWLSRIYSGITGEPIQMYSYGTGKLVNAAEEYAKQSHAASDVAGRIGGPVYSLQDMARAVRFDNVEDQEKFMNWMYQFLNTNTKEGNFINPWMSEDEWNALLPNEGYGPNEKLYSNILRGYLRSMPRHELMAMSRGASEGRQALSDAVERMNQMNRENGLTVLYSGLLGDVESTLRTKSNKSWSGLSNAEVGKIVAENKAKAVNSGSGFRSSNVVANDILSVLKRGILTYTYIIGDRSGNAGGTPGSNGGGGGGGPIPPNVPGLNPDVLNEVITQASGERNRLGNIARREQADQERQDRVIQQRQERQDREEEEERRRPVNRIEGLDSVVFHEGMSAEDTESVWQQVRMYETTDNESDNPDVERGRGYITSHLDSFRQRIAPDPNGSIMQNIKHFLETAPFELVKSGLELADDIMFKLVFGQDAASANPGDDTPPSLLKSLGSSIKGYWKQASDWFGENIGEPLKKFFFDKDTGLVSRLRTRVKDKIVEPIKETATKIKNKVIGEKELDAEGKETGKYKGGKLSNLINRTKDQIGSIKDSLSGKNEGEPSIIDRLLYGDYTTGKRKGTKFIQNRDEHGRFASGGHTEYQGLLGRLKQAGDKFSEMMFGPDANGDDHDSKAKAKFVKDELNKAAPDMLIGAGAMTAFNAGMGLLTGFALPGGPLVAPLLGAGIGFATSSEAFKKFLFGEEFEEEQEHYDIKTGKMVKKKVKTRKGTDLISKEVYESVKKAAPRAAIGGVGGAIVGGILPFGIAPVVGGIIGSLGGIASTSDAFKKLIFGDADSEEGDDSGLISKNFRKKFMEVLKERGGGAVIGKIAGSGAGLLAGGILPGVLGATLGPVLGTVGTVIGAVSGPKIMNMLFGEEKTEDVKDENGQPTGEKVKKRVGGLFGKAFDGLKGATEKVAKGFDHVVSKIGNWFDESILTPFSNALKPMKQAFSNAGNAVMDKVKGIASTIGDTIKAGFEKAFGAAVETPLKDFFKEKVITPLNNAVSKVFGAIGKVIGGILSAPFKLIEFIFTGKISSSAPSAEAANEENRERQEDQRVEQQRAEMNQQMERISNAVLETTANPVTETAPTLPEADMVTAAASGSTGSENVARPTAPPPKKHWWQRGSSASTGTVETPTPLPPSNMVTPAGGQTATATPVTAEGSPPETAVAGTPAEQQRPPKPTFFEVASETIRKRREEREKRKQAKEERRRKKLEEREQRRRVKQEKRDKKKQEKEARRNGSPSAAIGTPEDATGIPPTTNTGNQTPPSGGSTPETTASSVSTAIESGSGANDERDRLKDRAANRNETDNKQSASNTPPADNAPKLPESSSDESGSGSGKKRGKWRVTKTDNEYLASIEKHTRSIPKIFNEIKGQLGGSGWNIAYIKTLLDKHFGKLKANELPEEMEGSRNVNKKRTIFGKIADKVGGLFGGIKDAISDRISGIIDVVTTPFKLIGSVFGKIKDGLANAGDVLVGALHGIGSKLGDVFSFLASTLGTILKGAAEGIGKAFSGLGEFILGAGRHLGDALGNIVSTFTGVLSDGILGMSSMVLGLVQTASALFPDVAMTLWKGLKGVVGGIFKGGKWLIGGAKSLVGKLFGGKKDKNGNNIGKVKKKVETIGTFTIDGGFIDNIKNPIPVYIVGREEGEAARAGSVDNNGEPLLGANGEATGTPESTQATNGNQPRMGTTGIPTPPASPGTNAENTQTPPATVDNTATNNGTSSASTPQDNTEQSTEQPQEPDRMKRYRERQLARAGKSFGRAASHGGNIINRLEGLADSGETEQTSETPPLAVHPTPTPNNTSRDVNEGEPGKPQGAKPKRDSTVASDDTGETNTITMPIASYTALLEETDKNSDDAKKAADDFKKSYLDIDRVAEGAENPAEAYDQGVKHARSKEEINAILAANQMNTNDKEIEVLSGGGDEENGGFFSTLLSLFSGEGGILSKLGIAVAGTAAGATALGVAKTAGTVVGEGAGMAATGYQLTSDKGNKLWGAETLARDAVSIGKVVAGTAAEETLDKAPIKKAIAKVIKAITENETVVKMFGAVSNKLKTIATKLTEKLSGTILDETLEKVGTKAAGFAKQIGSFLTGGGLTIAFAVIDFMSGFGNAKKYFNVFGSDVTMGMRLTSGIVNTLGGLLSLIPGVGPVLSVVAAVFQDDIVQLVYNIIAGTAAQTELRENQLKLESATAAYNEENGTDLTVDDYSKTFNEDGSKKPGFFATIVNAFSKIHQSPLSLNTTTSTDTDETTTDSETGTGRRWGYGPSDTETPNVNDMLVSVFSDSDNLTNAFINIGKGVGTSFVDMATSVFRDAKKGPTIFSIIGQGLGSSLLDDLKDTEGKDATINNAISTAMVATSTGSSVEEASNTVKKTESNSTWSKIKSTVSSWLPWNWGKGPDEEGAERSWGTGPVKPMSQSSAKWNQSSNDMAKNGCGPTAAAMVASAYGDNKANPGEANKMSYGLGMRASDGGTNPKFFSKYASAHGYGMSEGPVSAGKLSSNLKNGQPAVVMGKGGAYGNNTHYLVADRVNGSSVGLVDPISGSRKSSTMGELLDKTSAAVYSYGKGPSETEDEDIQPTDETSDTTTSDDEKNETDTVDTTTTTATTDTTTKTEDTNKSQIADAQLALVNKMKSVLGTLKYSLGSVQDPDKGVASCASTVGWAYRKVLGVDNMSASSTTQSTDNRFSTIWVNNGTPLDTSILQQGDILYQNWDQTKNTGAMKHTEMYAGNGQDISHGGGIGPKMKDLNDYRKKHTMMVRRYTPFVNEDDIVILDNGSSGSTTSANGTTSADGSTSSTGSSILDALSTVFSGLSSKLGNILTVLLGGSISSSEDSSTDSSSTSGTTGANLGDSTETVEPSNFKSVIWNHMRNDFGLSEVGTAGLMGCWEAESGNKPNSLEGDYLKAWKNKYSSSAEVMSSNANMNDYTLNYLFPAYDRSGIKLNKDAYMVGDNYYPGVGLAGWTGGRAYNLLDLSNQNGTDWRTLKAQLDFFDYETPKSYSALKDALNNSSTVDESTEEALARYEKSRSFVATKDGQEWLSLRRGYANSIYNTYKGTNGMTLEEASKSTTGVTSVDSTTNDTSSTTTTAEPVTATAETSETGTGPSWGHGPDVDLTYNQTALMDRIKDWNKKLTQTRDDAESDTTVSTIANTITDALGGSTTSDESTALLKTIATTLGTMVDLLSKISENTAANSSGTTTDNSTTSINKKYSNLPASSPLYPSGEKSPGDVGLTIINRLTTV